MTKPPLYRIEVGLREELPDPAAEGLLAQFKTLGLPPPERARTVRLFWVEGRFPRPVAEALARELFSDPVVEKAAVNAPVYGVAQAPSPGRAQPGAAVPQVRTVEVVRKPGVMDPVVGSIRKALADRGLTASHIGTGRKFLFYGDVADDTLRLAGRRILANESI